LFELRYRRASARAASRTASSASALWNPRGLDGDIGMPAIRPREGQRPHRRGARAAVRGLCAYSRAFLAKKQIWPKPAPLFFMGPFLPCGTQRSRPRFGHVVVFHPPLFFRTPSPPIAHLDLHNTTRRQQQRWPLPSLLSASSRLRRSRPSVVACCARARLVRPADTHTAPYTSVWIEPPQRGSWDADADVFQVPRFPCPSRGTTPRVVPCETSLPCDACTSTPVAAVPPTHADPSHPQTTCSSQISLNKPRRARARPLAA
jgi:hypothetical protein